MKSFVTPHKESFWELAEMIQEAEKYKIDQHLQCLQFAPLSILKKIFIQYRFFTHYYIKDLAILISKLPFGKLKTTLADILSDELGRDDPNKAHPILYDQFLESLNIPSSDLQVANESCLKNLSAIQSSLIHNSWAYGVGLRGMGGECLCHIYLSTMYEFFSKNKAIQAMAKNINWTFWEIHIGEVDLHHQQMLRDAINEIVFFEADKIQELIAGYQQSKTAWDLYWKEIYQSAWKGQPSCLN